MTAGLPVVGAGVLVTVAGAVCTTVHLVMLAHHREPYLELMTAGTVAWFVAAALWTGGASPVRITPLLAVGAGGPLIHDAAVHAILLGFVVSMVMGHAPIVLPALAAATVVRSRPRSASTSPPASVRVV